MSDNIQRRMVLQEIAEAEELLSKEVNVSTIWYSDFKRTALPILQSVTTGEFNAQAWLQITGHPSVELSVLNDQTGEEQYRIPPMCGYTDFQEIEEFNLARVADEAAIMKSESPAVADQNLYDHLSLLQLDHNDLLSCQRRIVDTLNRVFEDHELPTIPTDVTDQKSDSVTDNDEPEILGYDLA